ncbi:unnamed protein product [Linum trigynum]|uniref:Uncharacterized protein n=1 Tax=Linum trigynum TaxID=586398 RepID=A0AAV2EAB9_9ROSI
MAKKTKDIRSVAARTRRKDLIALRKPKEIELESEFEEETQFEDPAMTGVQQVNMTELLQTLTAHMSVLFQAQFDKLEHRLDALSPETGRETGLNRDQEIASLLLALRSSSNVWW